MLIRRALCNMSTVTSTNTSTPTTPTTTPIPTPTFTPASESASEASSSGGSGPGVSRPTFSARLCLELLSGLTPAQINSEVNYLDSIDPDWCAGKPPRNPAAKRDALRDYLTNNLYADMDNTVNKYLTLFDIFSCMVKRAEEAITDITKGALDLLDEPGSSTASKEAHRTFHHHPSPLSSHHLKLSLAAV